ncbi:MAG: DUF4347 domain-containing protein [Nitrosomonas sp.]|uniref:DUF4347 domain-containing protein n=1 Tax=Nitrosomonas sp. TaxID=42353 RepID=UPI0025F8FB7C|nr:DUF4347 domain-containing protein [Nitrosomonas sp.]UJP03046.1 MAG: DUF4347 domain-containing protein [Nitrosomonas sp.]
MSRRIIFIDSKVTEYQSLIPQLPEDSEVIVLGASKDGVIQILEALQGKTEIGVIDIISHGASGSLMLGSIELNNANLAAYAEQLTQIGAHLNDTADILLYGCEVAQRKQGQAFIEQLSLLTGANVAASTNLTGAEALGGDWILEAYTGLNKANALQLSYSGVLSSTESRVNSFTLGDQSFPSIAGLSDGGFVVSWTSLDSGNINIYMQRYDASGAAVGSNTTVALTTLTEKANLFQPVTTGLSDGGFVISWTSRDDSLRGVYAQRYDANGVAQGAEFKVNTYTHWDQQDPTITGLSDGGFVVSWASVNHEGDPSQDIYAQRYDANGIALGAEFRGNSNLGGLQVNPSITGLSDGGYVISWESEDIGPSAIHAQRYDASGAAVGGEFLIDTGVADAFYSVITKLSDGGFLVSWTSESESFPGINGTEIYAQRYDASGVAMSGRFQVNSTTPNNQEEPAITGLFDGGFVVSWMSIDSLPTREEIHIQRYDANGVAQGSEFKVVNDTYNDFGHFFPSITALIDGGFVVSWTSIQTGSSTGDIYVKRYDANGNEVAIGSPIIEPADRLFNWAENTYTTLFPNHTASQEIAGYHARIYENGNALGEQSGNIYFYDSHSIVLVGTVDDFLPSAIAAGF